MNESSSPSTSGSPAPVIKPLDKDELWKKVAANNAVCKASNEGTPTTRVPVALAVQENQHELQREVTTPQCDHHATVDAHIGEAVSGDVSDLPLVSLGGVQALNPKGFPNRKKGSSAILATLANFAYMLEAYAVTVTYDVIKKRIDIRIPGHVGLADNHDNVAWANIISLCILNGMPTGQIASFLTAIADRNPSNQVADWIGSKAWDGQDRLNEFCNTIHERESYPPSMKKILLHRWLISAVAAVLSTSGFRSRGVLVLQGRQGIGKGEFFKALVPNHILSAMVVLSGHHLDGASKDSMTTAITHWIVELGELDSSFKNQIARLKAFLTNGNDKVRRPYGRLDSEYPRRTVFGASVNDNNFLVDDTGNSRWWTIACESINYKHGIDMQQLFSQMAVEFRRNEQWWLTAEEELMLEAINNSHRVVSMVRERILGAIDLQATSLAHQPALSAIELLEEVGLQRPTNSQCKECASILREIFGDSKRVNGKNVWRIALKSHADKDEFSNEKNASTSAEDDADLY